MRLEIAIAISTWYNYQHSSIITISLFRFLFFILNIGFLFDFCWRSLRSALCAKKTVQLMLSFPCSHFKKLKDCLVGFSLTLAMSH